MGGINLTNARQVAEGLGYQWDAELIEKIMAAALVIRDRLQKK